MALHGLGGTAITLTWVENWEDGRACREGCNEVRTLGFEPVGRVGWKAILVSHYYARPSREEWGGFKMVTPNTIIPTYLPTERSKSCVELNFLHQWPAEFTQVNKQRAHRLKSIWRGRHWVRKNNMILLPKIGGPGVLHGVLQTGSNKLSGLHGRLRWQMNEI